MGGLLARFRKEKTTFEILEKLEQRIKDIEEYGQNTERRRKQIVANLLIGSVGLYIISLLLFYIYSPPKPWSESLVYLTPFFVFPIVIITLKKVVAWHYTRKINRNASKLSELRTEKKKILEEVMDKETYKVARTILERFADRIVPSPTIATLSTPGNLRQRNVSIVGSQIVQKGVHSTPARTPQVMNPARSNFLASKPQTVISQPSSENALSTSADKIVAINSGIDTMKRPSLDQNRPLLRPVINADRGVFEKMVDYIVGDGPNNRFALICKQCHNHNGMALREEFEYLAFRCVFCATFNAARKQRPSAPPLTSPVQLAITQTTSSASTSSSDDEEKPLASVSGSETEEEQVEQSNDETNEINDAEKKEK